MNRKTIVNLSLCAVLVGGAAVMGGSTAAPAVAADAESAQQYKLIIGGMS